jgi:hypothetical protein
MSNNVAEYGLVAQDGQFLLLKPITLLWHENRVLLQPINNED